MLNVYLDNLLDAMEKDGRSIVIILMFKAAACISVSYLKRHTAIAAAATYG